MSVNAVHSDSATACPVQPAASVTEPERWMQSVFNHDRELHAYQHGHMDETLATRRIPASNPRPLPVSPRKLPKRVTLPMTLARYLSVPPLGIDFDQLLELVGTRGLLVWHDGSVVHEQYLKGHERSIPWMANSASKLIVAMLVARAQMDGVLGPDTTPITRYWPELSATAWEGVTVGHCRQMASGVGWTEEVLDLETGDPLWKQLFRELLSGSIDRFPGTVPRRDPPGTVLCYSSLDTEVLGGTLMRAAGASLAELLQRWLWSPAGMEHDALWVCDPGGRELALAGLCATLRDYARLGIVLLQRGAWNAQQMLPSEFCRRLENPDPRTFEMPGHDDYPLVPWEQAFIPRDAAAQRGDYMAAGSYGQIIYVNPSARTVVAHQGICADITTEYIDIHRLFMAFRAISDQIAG